MARNAWSAQFNSDPLVVLRRADCAIGGHDDLREAVAGNRAVRMALGSTQWTAANALIGEVNRTGTICFDLEPFAHTGRRMMTIKPVYDSDMFDLSSIGWWTRSYLPRPSDDAVRGYWFPYNTITPEQFAQMRAGAGPRQYMGYVEFPKQNPRYNFVFTGSMQGCHIVVTSSPTRPLTHYCAYHYPNAGSFTGFAGDMAFHLWPTGLGGVVHAWLDDTMYGHHPPEAVDAFNFLRYRNDRWEIVTQKQQRTTLLAAQQGVVMFEVKGSPVITPIPDAPIAIPNLLQRYIAWRPRMARDRFQRMISAPRRDRRRHETRLTAIREDERFTDELLRRV